MTRDPGPTKSHSPMIAFWNALPVMIRAILTGILVTIAGTLPWALLASVNSKFYPEIPWSIVPNAIYLWFYWRYISGKGWPRSTSQFRKRNLRAKPVNAEIWGASIFAGIMGLVTMLLFFSVLNRLIHLPQQSTDDVKQFPWLSLFFLLLMGSAVAGITEEAGFRGYMQGPIEKKHGPVIAILTTGIFFGLLHFSHPETTWALMPFYLSVAIIYGLIAYITGSILPGLVIHAVGDVLGGLQVFITGQSEWQTPPTPKPLVWESGADASFWLNSALVVLLFIITFFAYKGLAKVVKASPALPEL